MCCEIQACGTYHRCAVEKIGAVAHIRALWLRNSGLWQVLSAQTCHRPVFFNGMSLARAAGPNSTTIIRQGMPQPLILNASQGIAPHDYADLSACEPHTGIGSPLKSASPQNYRVS